MPAKLAANIDASKMSVNRSDGTALANSSRRVPPPVMAVQPPVELPPLGTKVKDVLVALRGPADRGNVSAACRVGLELSRCYQQRFMQKFIEDEYTSALRKDATSADTARRLKQLESYETLSAQDVQLCEGVQSADIEEAWSYLLQAASAGNVTAATYFATTPPTNLFVERSDVLDSWSAHREQFIQIGIRSGDLLSLILAEATAGTGFTSGGPVYMVPKDPYLAVEYAAAISLAMPDPHTEVTPWQLEMEKSLTPEQIASAKAAGQALWARYFKGLSVQSLSKGLSNPLHPERC